MKKHIRRNLLLILSFICFSLYCKQFYTSEVTAPPSASLFPPYIQKGKIKEDIKSLKKGEAVELVKSENERFFLVKSENANEIVPFGYIEPIFEEISLPACTDAQIEEYANESSFKSATKFFLWTDLSRLETYLLRDYSGKWKVIKRFPCSAGSIYHPTIRGLYKIQYKTKFIGKKGEYICKYAISFFEDYMYHSIVLGENGNYVLDGRLSQRISNGCIRHSIEDSLYIYKTVPIFTRVFIN